jgi:hypothetical protein
VSEVRMLPGAHRPEGALSWLSELLAEGEVSGVMVVAVYGNGDTDSRIFGEVKRYSVAFAGAILTDHAINGDYEP